MRQALALLALFGGGAFMYLWAGLPGFVGYGFGLAGAVVTLGIESGYWVGFDSELDEMVTRLAQWAKTKRESARE